MDLLTINELNLLKKKDNLTINSFRAKILPLIYFLIRDSFYVRLCDEEDLAEEIFLKIVLSKIFNYSANLSSFYTWIVIIAKGKIVDYYRANRDYIIGTIFCDYIDEYACKEDNITDLIELLKIILKDEELTYLTLYIVHDYSMQQIAAEHSVSRSKVSYTIKKAINKVKGHEELLKWEIKT